MQTTENLLNLSALPRLSQEEAQLLAKHFEVFTETTNKLVKAHQHLQEQIKLLVEEIEQKNQQLEAVNKELAIKIRETEEVREFLDRLIDSMQSGLVALDAEGNLTRMNRYARRLLGWQQGELSRLEEMVEPGTGNPVRELYGQGETSKTGEVRFRKADGDTVLVRYTAVPLAEPDDQEAGRTTGTLLVFEDLSELRLLEHKLRRADRLAALGELAAGVAHEMRNPLATMRGFLQLLPTEYQDPAFREECSNRLIQEIDRLARLTDELLELSRPIQSRDTLTDLVQLVEEVLAEQRESLQKQRIEVKGEATDYPSLPLDRERIKQVLLNIIINAQQAMPEGGRLAWRLETRREIWETTGSEMEFAALSISDTGVGIEPKHRDSLFDPFFTTKDQGTGLGLAICHRIMEEHGGLIQVESRVGEGSTFTLYFPIDSGA